MNISCGEIFIKKRLERMTTNIGDELRTSVLERIMLTNIDGDKSPNFFDIDYNCLICKYFCGHAGLRDMLYIIK